MPSRPLSTSPAISVRCPGRPLAGGLVVPWVPCPTTGTPYSRSLDADRARLAFLQHLCQICPQPFEQRFLILVRPADQEQGYSPEIELHPECQSACRCCEPTPDEGQIARSGWPADRYEVRGTRHG